ncbi:MAG: class I SAM-dependent methyltransferase [Gammaproteobacteria bacterium]
MSNRTIQVDDGLYQYILDVSLRELPLQKELREETASDPMANMQISPEQGQFMAMLVKLMGARNCIEVGVFTGYSSLAVAMAIPDDGRIVACDVSEEWTKTARRYWQRAGVEHKIDLHIAAAEQTLTNLVSGGGSGNYDFAFIDADKTGYARYVELCHDLLRSGGIIAIDNTLWGGSVIDESAQDDDTRAIRLLNEALHNDERFDISLLPLADGLTLLRKR